jgi:hypothetical protein
MDRQWFVIFERSSVSESWDNGPRRLTRDLPKLCRARVRYEHAALKHLVGTKTGGAPHNS